MATEEWVGSQFQPLLIDNGGTEYSQQLVHVNNSGGSVLKRLVAQSPLVLRTNLPQDQDGGNVLMQLSMSQIVLGGTNQVTGFDQRVQYILKTTDTFMTAGRANADGTIAYQRGYGGVSIRHPSVGTYLVLPGSNVSIRSDLIALFSTGPGLSIGYTQVMGNFSNVRPLLPHFDRFNP